MVTPSTSSSNLGSSSLRSSSSSSPSTDFRQDVSGSLDSQHAELGSVFDDASSQSSSAKERVSSALNSAKGQAQNAYGQLLQRAQGAREYVSGAKVTTQEYMTANPWRSAMIVGVAGLVLGAMLGRRR